MPSPQFPTYNSPFEDASIFNDETPKYVTHINFPFLFKEMMKFKSESDMPWSYSRYESKKIAPIILRVGPIAFTMEKILSPDPLLEELKEILEELEILPKSENEKELKVPPGYKRVDIEQRDEKGKSRDFNGKMNIKQGAIKIAPGYVGFGFTLDPKQLKILYTDYFYYYDFFKKARINEYALIIEAKSLDDYLELCRIEGLRLSDISKETIALKFTEQLSAFDGKPFEIGWLYSRMPDFVFKQREKKLLLKDLITILHGDVKESGFNDEGTVLKIIAAFNTNNPEDQYLILTTLKTTFIGKDTAFEVLYDKMNDSGGKPNFTAAIVALYKLWTASKYKDPDLYTSKGEPETLAYHNKKILGFYNNDFRFKFDKEKIVVERKRILELDKGDRERWDFYAKYDIFQPLSLLELNQSGEMALPAVIPAFYLKAFDDKAAWKNFEKSIWLAIDIATTFLGVGNLLKLRHLANLGKGIYTLRVTTASLQVASGVIGTMLNFVNDCSGETFCHKLRIYLFWLDLATISTDLITEKMLRKAAREAFDNAPSTLSSEIRNHLKDVARGNIYGDSALAYHEIRLGEYLSSGRLIGQTTNYTCVSASLRMILADKGIEIAEDVLATALRTSQKGASLLDIPKALKSLGISNKIRVAVFEKHSLQKLAENMKPNKIAIVSMEIDEATNHALIIDKISNGRVYLRDPLPLAWGSSYHVSYSEFKKYFNKKFLIINN